MQKEIGSNFDLNPDAFLNSSQHTSSEPFGSEGADTVFLSAGRGAEAFVLDTLQRRNPCIKKVALIPPFTCETVIEPFIKAGYTILTYPVSHTLDVDIEEFKNRLIVSGAQVVLVHRYFGFDTLKGFEKVIEEYNQQGVVFIEDKTQCLYSNFHELSADYVIGSMRKWAALPDGGYAVCREGMFSDKPEKYDKTLGQEKLEASYLKYYYLHEDRGEKQEYLEKFRNAEKTLNEEKGFFRISPASQRVQESLDIEELKRKRRQNYTRLYEKLKICRFINFLTPKLGDKEVPLYFVIQVEDRDKLQEKLREENIYAPIVWPQANNLPWICKEAQYIYDTVLCLPVDQRYDTDDMDRIVKAVKEYEQTCKQ